MSQKEIKETTGVAEELEGVDGLPATETKQPETGVGVTAMGGNATEAAAANAVTTEDEDLEAQLAFQTIKRNREKRKRRRIILIAVVAVVALVGLVLFITTCSGPKNDPSLTSMAVTGKAYVGDFQNTIKVNGSTEPNKMTVVSPEIEGIIENVRVAEGDYVNKDDVLFSIKNTDIEKTIADADKDLQNARDAADKANRAVDDAYTTYNKAVDAYNASASDMPFEAETYRAGITAAEDAYNEALKAVEAAQRARDETVAKADKRTVRAPVSGTLVSMTAVNGASISAANSSTSLAQIADLSQMKVTVQVNEADVSSVKPGQEGTVTFSAIQDLSLPATVQHISSISSGSHSNDSASVSTGSAGGVVTYPVDLIIPNPDPRLKPGMTATVNIVTVSVPNATIVPVAAVSDGEDGGKQVMVVDNEKTGESHAVPVEVVAKGSSEAAVRGEIKDGDSVLLASIDDMSLASGAGSADTGAAV